jgi:ADP-heptose:LPS heptosyltransferase
MIPPSTENSISVIVAHRGSDRHLHDVFLDLKLWFSDVTIVGPDCSAISEIKTHGGYCIASESPSICDLWEKGMQSKNSSWYLLLEGREYLSTILKESIVETANSTPDRQTWFPVKREIFLLKQRLKYPLEWTHDPRSGLLFVGTEKSNRIDPALFSEQKPLKGKSVYFAESTAAEVIKNAVCRADQAADQLYQTNPDLGPLTLLLKTLTASLSNFFKNWILRKGMREGFEGLAFSVLELVTVLLGHLRYYEKYIRSGRHIADKLSSVKNILVVKLRGLGDVVLGTPVLKNLKKTMPSVSISVITFNFSRPVFENNPHVDELFSISGHPESGELAQIIKKLNSKNFDLIINLHARNFSSKLVKKIRARWKINSSYFIREKYSDVLIGSDHALDKASVERNLDCLRAIGLNPQDKNPEIFVTDEETQWAEDFMVKQKMDLSKKLIIIHPTTKNSYTDWGVERFIMLSRKLIHEHGHQVLSCFPKKEQSIAKSLLDQLEGIFVHVGSLRQSMALISKANLMIDNCSGPSHISSALGIPTLVLMGADYKNIYRDRDLYKEKSFLFYQNVPCRDLFWTRCLPPDPCQNHVCLDHSVEDVLKKSLELLSP